MATLALVASQQIGEDWENICLEGYYKWGLDLACTSHFHSYSISELSHMTHVDRRGDGNVVPDYTKTLQWQLPWVFGELLTICPGKPGVNRGKNTGPGVQE